jgi:hypothetical protein
MKGFFSHLLNTVISALKYRMHLLAQAGVSCILQLIWTHGIRGVLRWKGILPRKEDMRNEA